MRLQYRRQTGGTDPVAKWKAIIQQLNDLEKAEKADEDEPFDVDGFDIDLDDIDETDHDSNQKSFMSMAQSAELLQQLWGLLPSMPEQWAINESQPAVTKETAREMLVNTSAGLITELNTEVEKVLQADDPEALSDEVKGDLGWAVNIYALLDSKARGDAEAARIGKLIGVTLTNGIKVPGIKDTPSTFPSLAPTTPSAPPPPSPSSSGALQVAETARQIQTLLSSPTTTTATPVSPAIRNTITVAQSLRGLLPSGTEVYFGEVLVRIP